MKPRKKMTNKPTVRIIVIFKGLFSFEKFSISMEPEVSFYTISALTQKLV
jgi:hypothetical protein